ncbi:dynamin family protein [Fontibacillus phaseoli]|uniref:Dynamin family protein n=1 Tax=Fontibacillus phaseoli TaxID=1416533 RepID=A0A369BP28_9BACL|nr:dynamin family protein [Fontibacillus phaseoli]RCX23370.1 dynamin family protein [Fontibacillus phaseoli]
METITKRHDFNLDEQLVTLEEWYALHGDAAVRREVHDLREKWSAGKLTLSFCGHFSAGKSSLINTLCGKAVLPSGPIPTTANIAALHHGPPKAMLTPVDPLNGREGRTKTLEVTLDSLDEYCRDGNSYEMVSIWDDIPLLRDHGVLLDTPGVDSGDAAHALATNSALHLGDVVFYVMDYNHVLSESNLSFARRLADWGKPFYLVVNQIDKHRERELKFENYRASVEQAFELWNIVTAGVFYISLKEPEHRLNMLPILKQTIQSLLSSPQGLLEYSITCSLLHGGEDYLKRCKAAGEEEQERLLAEVGGEKQVEALKTELLALDHELESSQDKMESLRREWLMELDSLLGSAYLMTPGLREAAGLYLESRQPGFKTGLLFQRGKTEREQQRRSDDFLAKLKEQGDAQVDWHVRDLLRKFGRSHELWDPAWESRMEQELPRAEEAWISGPAKDGAVLSGEYTLRYTADVAAGITGRYRRAALVLLDGLLDALAPRLVSAQASLAAQREALLARSAAGAQLQAQRAAAYERAEQLHALLGPPASLPPGLLPEVRGVPATRQPAQQPPPPVSPARASASAPQQTESAQATDSAAAAAAGVTPSAAMAPPAATAGRQRLMAAAAALDAAAEALSPYPAFGSGVRELHARASHLRGGRFTVALFGAFSAGKSSFANALLGGAVLPVSPHPTTAAINRILAPEDGMEHGRAKIIFKSPEAMHEDLAYSFEALQLGSWKERNWRDAVHKLRVADVPPTGRAHYSFLKAAASGWDESAPLLGTVRITGLEEFASYVAEESKACFVEQMDLYYACPLTEQGIVIVDTPGADSIHARHTGVTFQYMKNSDALLYVTYYNHAFSRADRQFLAHLGRVKGSFALDKMFFIVNAADLASSPEELAMVVEHVSDGLRGAGIEEPRIHAVSSLAALTAKTLDDGEPFAEPGFAQFEDAFFDFIGTELTGLAVNTARRELETVMERAREWSGALAQSREERQEMLAIIQEDKRKLTGLLQNLAENDQSITLRQEAEELLFHVRNRLRLSAGDMFHEFFHPTLLQEDGGNLKVKFAASFRGWLSQLSVELERELQATTLRLEKKCDHLVASGAIEWYKKVKESLKNVPVFTLEPFSFAWTSPEIREGTLQQRLRAEDYLSYFKSPRAFFEGGGKQKLREVLSEPIEKILKEATEEAGQELARFYCSETARRFSELASRYESEWEEWESAMAQLAAGPENADQEDETQWNEVISVLNSLVSVFGD